MAPLERITSVKVYKVIGIFLVLTSLGLGISSFYIGLTNPTDAVILGVEDDFMFGFFWILNAIYWGFFSRKYVSREASVTE